MKNIKNYKNRFFSLLESEMGNVKPLITEVSESVKNNVMNMIEKDFGFYKANEEDKEGTKQITFKKEFGDKVLGILIGLNPEGEPLSNVIIVIPFLKKEGGVFEKITSEVTGTDEKFIGVSGDKFATEGKDIINKIIEYVESESGGEESTESADYTEMIKDLMKKTGFQESKTDDGSMLFVKRIDQGKSFLIKIKEEGSMVKIFPLVFDHEAHKDPVFYGKELPVRVGTINIETDQTDNPKVLSLDIDKGDISGSESKITQTIETGERLAQEYKGKFDAMKSLEDDSDFTIR
jgi:hypothetical protein